MNKKDVRKPKVYPKHKNTYWGCFAKGFLEIAKNNLKTMKKDNIVPRQTFSQGKPLYSITDSGLWLATIWNIKHGIELIIKSLGIDIDEKYWRTHDLEELISDLETRIKDIDEIKDSDEWFQFIKIIDKYYKNNFFKKSIVITDKKDINNDFFRFPQLPKRIDISVLHDVKMTDIENFIKEVVSIINLAGNLEGKCILNTKRKISTDEKSVSGKIPKGKF